MDHERIEELEKLLAEYPELWWIEREPHTFPDGTNHFVHVFMWDNSAENKDIRVEVGSYLTEGLAQLLVKLKAAAPALLATAKERNMIRQERDNIEPDDGYREMHMQVVGHLRAAEAERDKLKAGLAETLEVVRKLDKVRDMAFEWLSLYSRHAPDCDVRQRPSGNGRRQRDDDLSVRDCTCGLRDLHNALCQSAAKGDKTGDK